MLENISNDDMSTANLNNMLASKLESKRARFKGIQRWKEIEKEYR